MSYSGLSREPFHPLQTTQALKSYIDVLSHLVAFLLRDKGNYFILLPANIVTLVSKIQQLTPLEQLPPPVIQENFDEYTLGIVDLLIGIWTRVWDPSLGNIIGDPTMCFLALSSIKADNGWALATEITPVIARLIFCIRSVFLFRVHID